MIIIFYLSLGHEIIVYKQNAYFFFVIEQTTDREVFICPLFVYSVTTELLSFCVALLNSADILMIDQKLFMPRCNRN
jgi:hypothetical protein